MLPFALVGVRLPGQGGWLIYSAGRSQIGKASRIFLQMCLWALKKRLTDWFAPVVVANQNSFAGAPIPVATYCQITVRDWQALAVTERSTK
jgi:hypothetical protein